MEAKEAIKEGKKKKEQDKWNKQKNGGQQTKIWC